MISLASSPRCPVLSLILWWPWATTRQPGRRSQSSKPGSFYRFEGDVGRPNCASSGHPWRDGRSQCTDIIHRADRTVETMRTEITFAGDYISKTSGRNRCTSTHILRFRPDSLVVVDYFGPTKFCPPCTLFDHIANQLRHDASSGFAGTRVHSSL